MTDATFFLVRELPSGGSERLQVRLARGGDQFPWASDGKKIFVGPPSEGDQTLEGVDLSGLSWHVTPYWVLGASGENGEAVELTPEEWALAASGGANAS
jgi:hypothetical protein